MHLPLADRSAPSVQHSSNLQTLTEEIDGCVRDMLRARRDEAFARSVQEGTQVSQAIAQSRCAGALAQDFSAVLPPELSLRVLESVDVADVRRVMQVNTRCRDLARTTLGSAARVKDCWRTGSLSAQRTFDGPGFVTGCRMGPYPCGTDAGRCLALKGDALVIYEPQPRHWQTLQSVQVDDCVALTWTPDFSAVQWVTQKAQQVEIWRAPAADLSACERLAAFAEVGSANALAVHPTRSDVCVVGAGNDLVVVEGGNVVARLAGVRLQGLFGDVHMAWHRRGSHLAVQGDKQINVFDMRDLHAPRGCAQIAHNEFHLWMQFAWHPTELQVAAVTGSVLCAWDVSLGARLRASVRTQRPSFNANSRLAVSPRGNVLCAKTVSGVAFYAWHGDVLEHLRDAALEHAETADHVHWSANDPKCVLLTRQRVLWAGALRCS